MPEVPLNSRYQVGAFIVDPASNRIQLGDEGFALEPKVMGLLCELIRHQGQVCTRDELVSRVWGASYPSDEGLTRNISILRKLMRKDDTIAEYIETIPTRGYRLVPQVLSLSDSAAPERSASARVPVENAPSAAPVLAVLPFENQSNDPQMAYFSDGVSEEILQTVAQGTSIKVIGRGASFQFRGKDKVASAVGAQLNASHILDGAVRRVDDRVRINAQLIECASQTMVWSQRFDRDIGDIFALEDEIAGEVADALRTQFAPSAHTDEINAEAYDYYLRARTQLDRQFGSAGMANALPLYEAAVAAAPSFARAWALLAQSRAYVLRSYPDHALAQVSRDSVLEAASQALRLDDSCGIAYLALNGLEAWGSFTSRVANVDQALLAAPKDPEVIMAAANLSARVGRLQESVAYAQKAYAINSSFPVAGFYCVTMQAFDGHYQATRALSDELLERFPQVEYMWTAAMSAAADHSDWARLDRIIEQLNLHGPAQRLNNAVRVVRAVQNQDQEFLAQYLARAESAVARQGWLDFRVINTLFRMGAVDETFSFIEQMDFAPIYDPNARPPGGWTNESLIFNRGLPHPMLNDPRVVTYLHRLGLAHYWVTSDRWPDCAEHGVLPYDFKALVQESVARQPVPGAAA